MIRGKLNKGDIWVETRAGNVRCVKRAVVKSGRFYTCPGMCVCTGVE